MRDRCVRIDAALEDGRPCFVELGIDEDRNPPVYAARVELREAPSSDEELSTMRDRVGRIARRLEDVTAELRMLAEGLSPEESARTLERIEESLGIGKKA